MSPHNDRSTSQAPATPDPHRLDAILASFFPSRRNVRSSTQSVRLPGSACHSVQPTRISSWEERNGPRTSDVKGAPGTFHTFSIGSSCQYWGRRRYGPARQAFRLA